MTKIIMFLILLTGVFYLRADAQKKYAYAILNMRCGNEQPHRDRLYFSPIIELNTLNFPKYTEGIDPAIPIYSVRYYNYALLKWFELFIKQYYNIQVTDPEKYERKFTSVLFNEKNSLSCNDQKTNIDCFFTDKNELAARRDKAIKETKLLVTQNQICEVVSLD
ncbi:MAG: hypothetical protein ABIN67_23455 [Ferruginibacter sp.]